ncbi:hypothetical protein HRbin15_01697 [bacterium HR15]|nr:hypothetical protein HRbin15_01697 [bacterium HR15]
MMPPDEVSATTHKASNTPYRRVVYEREDLEHLWRKKEYLPNGSGR